jgi:hypothetical protein
LLKYKREIRVESFSKKWLKKKKKKKSLGLGGFPPPSPRGRLGPVSGRVRPRSDYVVKERRF